MKARIKVGIVGAGSDRGWARASHIPALRTLSEYEIVAVSASRQETAEQSAQQLGVKLAFSDYRDLIARPEIDLVTIAVNVTHHREMAEAALLAGKMVYCEWPLGRNLTEAAALDELAAAKKLHTVVGLQGRFSPVVRYVRDLVAAGEIGRVLGTSLRGIGPDKLWHGTLDPAFEITADVANGNTLLAIPMGHALDILTYVLGEFESVSSTLVVGRADAVRTRDGAIVPVTAADQVAITGTLVSGALASVHFHGGEPHGPTFEWQINGIKADLRIVAQQGYANINSLEVQDGRSNGVWTRLQIPASYKTAPDDIPEAAANVHSAYAQFAADLRNRTSSVPNFSAGLRRHRLLAAIEAADRTGRRQALS